MLQYTHNYMPSRLLLILTAKCIIERYAEGNNLVLIFLVFVYVCEKHLHSN